MLICIGVLLLLCTGQTSESASSDDELTAQLFELHLWRLQFERSNSDEIARREIARLAESIAAEGRTGLISEAMRASMLAVASAFRSSLAAAPATYPAPRQSMTLRPPCARDVLPANLSKAHVRRPTSFPIVLGAVHVDQSGDEVAHRSRARSGVECRSDAKTGASTCAYTNVCFDQNRMLYFADDLPRADAQLEGAWFVSARDSSLQVRCVSGYASGLTHGLAWSACASPPPLHLPRMLT